MMNRQCLDLYSPMESLSNRSMTNGCHDFKTDHLTKKVKSVVAFYEDVRYLYMVAGLLQQRPVIGTLLSNGARDLRNGNLVRDSTHHLYTVCNRNSKPCIVRSLINLCTIADNL